MDTPDMGGVAKILQAPLERAGAPSVWRRVCGLLAAASMGLLPLVGAQPTNLWSLKPVVRPAVPEGLTSSTNPVDAFVAKRYRALGLKPAQPASRLALLRRVCLDLVGLPPTPAEQAAFLADTSPDAYEKVVDRLLASEQHGVRYARHWLDVLRYADADDRMAAAAGIHLWRDWVIRAINEDTPYDDFVRAQLTGYRKAERTAMSATGVRYPLEPRPDDVFALGFLARGAVPGTGAAAHELAISAVETVSTAFMGMTVGCAKCHDHRFDPISRRDFYAMKALFDPLVLRKVTLAPGSDLFAAGRAAGETARARAAIEKPLEELLAPYKQRLHEERLAMLPSEVQAVIRKPEKERTAAEQKIADDYYPILRLDSDKLEAVMPEEGRQKFRELRKRLESVGAAFQAPSIPVFWTVEVDHGRERDPSYILTSGDAERPETNHVVTPGWPFGPRNPEFREGRVEAFSDWLTAGDNPLLARVAVNRMWQWHFGEGLKSNPSDFGALGGAPANPELLDWLASEFARLGFSMKQMHRLIVTSETYQLATEAESEVAAGNGRIDSADACWWRFPLQRLDAEAIWDSMMSAAGGLDLTVGGSSFDAGKPGPGVAFRRAAYLRRGFSTSRDVMAAFLQAFDVDDGRAPCPLRAQTVTAPQGLFMMNSPEVEQASTDFAARLARESHGDLNAAVDLGYQAALGRNPSPAERRRVLEHLGTDANRLKNLAWLLFNLDEFVYVP